MLNLLEKKIFLKDGKTIVTGTEKVGKFDPSLHKKWRDIMKGEKTERQVLEEAKAQRRKLGFVFYVVHIKEKIGFHNTK